MTDFFAGTYCSEMVMRFRLNRQVIPWRLLPKHKPTAQGHLRLKPKQQVPAVKTC